MATSKKVTDLSADEILLIGKPEDLFTGPDTVEDEFKDLAKLWHTDKNHSVGDNVFKKINELRKIALLKIKEGSWQFEGAAIIQTVDKKKFKIKYRRHRSFELGDMYICDTAVAYLIKKSEKDLFDNSLSMVKNFKFSSDRMKKEVERYLPKITNKAETDTHFFVTYEKATELYSLRDVLMQQNGKMPLPHLAWIISSLCNLNCYFKHVGISHNDISLDTYFISPKHHYGAMLGGWWYAKKVGGRLTAVPSRTFNLLPSLSKEKIGSTLINSELIKATGREMLGDLYGTKLISDSTTPKPLLAWLRSPGDEDTYKEYKTWIKQVLPDSFGKRRFTKFEVTDKEIYT